MNIELLEEIKKRLKKFFERNKEIKVIKFKGSTNPVVFYNKWGASKNCITDWK